jgi:hypothetical protein
MAVPKEGLVSSCLYFKVPSMSPSWLVLPAHDCGNTKRITDVAFSLVKRGRQSLTLAALLWALAASPSLAIDVSSACGSLSLVSRSMIQDQGAWDIDYRFRYTGKTGVIVTPEEIVVKVEGWVSNSRVPSHALPRWSCLRVSHGPDLTAISEVITAADEGHRCRERLVVSVSTEDQSPFRASSGALSSATAEASRLPAAGLTELASIRMLSLGPDIIIRVRLRLEHQHILYGEYDPLLAMRAVTVRLGSMSVGDIIPLDREQYLAQPRFTWPEPPEERRDTRHAVSGPDSLHLEAHVPGHQYYRYLERPVRYSTRMRLRFWYLIAAGTEGDCKIRVAQCKETPISWRMLNSGGFEECLKTVGRWTKVERIIQTECEATTLTLEFKIVGETEVGEMWIDDVSVEPIGCDGLGGP